MLYRTDDATRWGIGKGANLTPSEIDLNFWDIAERLVAVEGGGASPNSIANITVVGSQMTVYLDDGTALGPYTLPTAMIRYRGDWVAGAAYSEMDLVAAPGDGIYLVLRDHTSAATFDANAVDASGNPLYRFLFPIGAGSSSLADLADVWDGLAPTQGQYLMWDGTQWDAYPLSVHINDLDGVYNPEGATTGQVLAFNTTGTGWWEPTDLPAGGSLSVSDEGVQVLASATDINFAGAGVVVTNDGDGTVTVTVGGGGAAALNDLSDVALAMPAAADYLRFDGAAWVDAPLAWADIPDKPATFPPSPHTHPWADVMGKPATIDAIPAALGAAGTIMKVSADGATLAWAADESSGTSGALNDLSDVAITTPAAADVLQFDGTGWVNSPLGWGEIAEKPATFPPSAHTHPWGEVTGRPATIDAIPATIGVDGQVLKASAGGIVWATDETGGGGGPTVSEKTASYTFALTDGGNFVDYNAAGAGSFTIADDATANFPVGTVIAGGQIGAGALTIQAAGGVVLNGVTGGGATLIDSSSEYSVRKRAANSWRIAGDHGGVA